MANNESSQLLASKEVSSNFPVFVYGTLRQGASNHWRMMGAKYQGSAKVTGRLYRIDWYPGLVLDQSGIAVCGEIYHCDEALLQRLDEFEGTVEYRRVIASVTTACGKKILAEVWEYYLNIDNHDEIITGNWIQY